jgi:hypothetical protein
VLSYRRFHAGRWITVALNFSDEPQVVEDAATQEILISTHLDRAGVHRGKTLSLRRNEGVVLAAA